MRRILILILIAVAVAGHSCTRDADVGKAEALRGYDTSNEAIAAAESLYGMGAPTFYGERSAHGIPAAMIGGWLSGFFESGGSSDGGLYDACRSLDLEGEAVGSYAKEVWEEARKAIEVTGELIAAVPHTAGLSEEQKGRFVAEALFFRAFNRFWLAKMFGAIPAAGKDGVNNNLTSVYASLIEDLEKAAGVLPDKSFADNGLRVTRSAAQTLLADIYLTMMSGSPLGIDRYAEAAATARKVIAAGKHSLTQNGETPAASAYNALRADVTNPEYIFAYRDRGSLASFSLPAAASAWGVVKTATADACLPSGAMLKAYDPYLDLRGQEGQFFHSFVGYEKDGRTVFQTFEPRSHLWFDREALFGSTAAVAAEGNEADNRGVGTGAGTVANSIYRYAEVLLIAAEAIAMSEGVTTEAVSYLADVRTRAWTKTTREAIIADLSTLSPEKFVEEVWAERLREFPFEMKLWPDIQRTRKYPVVAPDEPGTITFRNVVGTVGPAGIPFMGKHLLLPLPKPRSEK